MLPDMYSVDTVSLSRSRRFAERSVPTPARSSRFHRYVWTVAFPRRGSSTTNSFSTGRVTLARREDEDTLTLLGPPFVGQKSIFFALRTGTDGSKPPHTPCRPHGISDRNPPRVIRMVSVNGTRHVWTDRPLWGTPPVSVFKKRVREMVSKGQDYLGWCGWEIFELGV